MEPTQPPQTTQTTTTTYTAPPKHSPILPVLLALLVLLLGTSTAFLGYQNMQLTKRFAILSQPAPIPVTETRMLTYKNALFSLQYPDHLLTNGTLQSNDQLIEINGLDSL